MFVTISVQKNSKNSDILILMYSTYNILTQCSRIFQNNRYFRYFANSYFITYEACSYYMDLYKIQKSALLEIVHF